MLPKFFKKGNACKRKKAAISGVSLFILQSFHSLLISIVVCLDSSSDEGELPSGKLQILKLFYNKLVDMPT